MGMSAGGARARAAFGGGGGEFSLNGGEVSFEGFELRTLAGGGGRELGFAPREVRDAGVELPESHERKDGNAAGGVLLLDVRGEGEVARVPSESWKKACQAAMSSLADGGPELGRAKEEEVEV